MKARIVEFDYMFVTDEDRAQELIDSGQVVLCHQCSSEGQDIYHEPHL